MQQHRSLSTSPMKGVRHLKHGSLFSGGGGFDLAAERMGWENVFHCEKDTFCQTILKHYWPKAETLTDIKEFNAEKYKGKIDIVTGGFPCQPFSAAGKRKGTSDDRYLWPAMYRIIRTIKPRWVVCENVYGLVNWNEGMVFDKVQSDLEAEGYEVATYVLPAAGVNAPHQRYRVWIIGYSKEHSATRSEKAAPNTHSFRREFTLSGGKAEKKGTAGNSQHPDCLCTAQLDKTCANANCNGCNRVYGKDEKQPGKTGKYAQRNPEPMGEHAPHTISQRLQCKAQNRKLARGRPVIKSTGNRWRKWPTQPPLCGGDDGLPTQLDNITFPKWRTASVRMFGNAVVPDVALQIFKAIRQFEQEQQG